MAVLASCAAELRVMGPANLLYSDGDTLFTHGDRRKNGSTRKVGPPGLVLLRRYCSRDSRDGMAPGISIEGQDHFVTLVASVPLSDDIWEPLGEGEIVALKDGEAVRFPLGSHYA